MATPTCTLPSFYLCRSASLAIVIQQYLFLPSACDATDNTFPFECAARLYSHENTTQNVIKENSFADSFPHSCRLVWIGWENTRKNTQIKILKIRRRRKKDMQSVDHPTHSIHSNRRNGDAHQTRSTANGTQHTVNTAVEGNE